MHPIAPLSNSHHKQTKHAHIRVYVRVFGVTVPLADSFLVLMIFAAYSCPDDFFTHLRTTEKAPLRKKNINNQKSVPFHILPPTHTHSVTFETESTSVAVLCYCVY